MSKRSNFLRVIQQSAKGNRSIESLTHHHANKILNSLPKKSKEEFETIAEGLSSSDEEKDDQEHFIANHHSSDEFIRQWNLCIKNKKPFKKRLNILSKFYFKK